MIKLAVIILTFFLLWLCHQGLPMFKALKKLGCGEPTLLKINLANACHVYTTVQPCKQYSWANFYITVIHSPLIADKLAWAACKYLHISVHTNNRYKPAAEQKKNLTVQYYSKMQNTIAPTLIIVGLTSTQLNDETWKS